MANGKHTQRPTSSSPSALDLAVIDASTRALADPAAFDEMLAAWEHRLLAAQSGEAADLSVLAAALSALGQIVERLPPAIPTDGIDAAVTAAPGAALALARSGDVLSQNAEAQRQLGERQGRRAALGWLTPEARAAARSLLAGLGGGHEGEAGERRAVLRLEDGRLAEASAQRGAPPFLLLRLLHLPWSPPVGEMLAESFGLSSAEQAVARALYERCDLALVAEARGTSVATVRAQLRSIYAKTETRAQAELVRLVALLCGGALGEEAPPAVPPWRDTAGRLVRLGPPGARIAYTSIGAPPGRPGGRAGLLLHGPGIGIALPRALDAALSRAKITLYAPCRPGHGETDALADEDAFAGASRVAAAVAADAGLRGVPVLGLNCGGTAAFRVAADHPGLLSRMVWAGGCVPPEARAGYDDVPHAQKVMILLARHAPFAIGLIGKMSFRIMRQAGADWYLERAYAQSPVDRKMLDEPEARALLRNAVAMLSTHAELGYGLDLGLTVPGWSANVDAARLPTRVLHGRHDATCAPGLMTRFAARRADLSVEIEEAAGELVAYQAPVRLAEAVIDAFDAKGA